MAFAVTRQNYPPNEPTMLNLRWSRVRTLTHAIRKRRVKGIHRESSAKVNFSSYTRNRGNGICLVHGVTGHFYINWRFF
jgi:hypothetical protein